MPHLAQLSDLLVESSDRRVGHVARVLVHHVVDRRIHLWGDSKVPVRTTGWQEIAPRGIAASWARRVGRTALHLPRAAERA